MRPWRLGALLRLREAEARGAGGAAADAAARAGEARLRWDDASVRAWQARRAAGEAGSGAPGEGWPRPAGELRREAGRRSFASAQARTLAALAGVLADEARRLEEAAEEERREAAAARARADALRRGRDRFERRERSWRAAARDREVEECRAAATGGRTARAPRCTPP